MSKHPVDPAPLPGEDEDQDDTVTTVIAGTKLTWDSCAQTDVGKVRRINEDACMKHARDPLWVVADGMGGHAKGDVASSGIAAAFAALVVPEQLSAFADLAEETLIGLNGEFRALADFGREGATIGSTVVILAVLQAYALFLWVGDSRIYRSRRGRFEQLTQDHSQVEEMVSQGLLRREDAESHPNANVVTRAVGAADEICVDMDYCGVEDGDRFLLCSDGLTKEVPESEIAEILAQDADAATLSRRLIERTLCGNARDNVTVIVVIARSGQDAP